MARASPQRGPRHIRLLLTAAVAACTVWPHWYPVSEHDSGLVGEWVGQPAWSNGDTIVWRFDSAGTADRSRILRQGQNSATRVSEDRESLGRWRVYDDSTHLSRRFVCFDYGRQRARLPCWYFTIERIDNAGGLPRRALELLGQVGGRPQAPEVYAERDAARNK